MAAGPRPAKTAEQQSRKTSTASTANADHTEQNQPGGSAGQDPVSIPFRASQSQPEPARAKQSQAELSRAEQSPCSARTELGSPIIIYISSHPKDKFIIK